MRFDAADFEYALENTHVIYAPAQRIATFGDTQFDFVLVSELMDEIGKVRVRNGRIEAQRPTIVTPEKNSQLLLDGFDNDGGQFLDWLKEEGINLAFLKYGFEIRKTRVSESILSEPLASVLGRLKEDLDQGGEALIHGVDDTWEVCLLKYTVDLVQHSASKNLGDFRKRGLL
ncbi:MAG: hypothetical protein ACFCU3_10765 [Verrucomicrobiales bacterium]